MLGDTLNHTQLVNQCFALKTVNVGFQTVLAQSLHLLPRGPYIAEEDFA